MGLLGDIVKGVGSIFGGGSSIGGVIGGLLGSGADYAASAEAAREDRQFQEKMYRHAVQYRVEDLKAAGVNPMLAAGMGLSGGIPGGAMARTPDIVGNLARVSQASSAATIAQKESDLMESQRDLNSAHAEEVRSRIPVNEQMVGYYVAQATHAYASAGEAEAQKRFLQESLPKLAAEIKNIQASTNELERRAALHRAEETLKGATETQLKALMPFMIDIAKSDAILRDFQIPPAKAFSDAAKSDFGKLAAYFKGLSGSQILAIALRAFFTDAVNEEK